MVTEEISNGHKRYFLHIGAYLDRNRDPAAEGRLPELKEAKDFERSQRQRVGNP
jgi:hypothetical protein